MDVIKPDIIFALPGINPGLMTKVVDLLVTERKYILLDMEVVIENAIKRGTYMGKKFASCTQ